MFVEGNQQQRRKEAEGIGIGEHYERRWGMSAGIYESSAAMANCLSTWESRWRLT